MTDRRRPSSWRRPSRFYFFFFENVARDFFTSDGRLDRIPFIPRASRGHLACSSKNTPFSSAYYLTEKKIFFFCSKTHFSPVDTRSSESIPRISHGSYREEQRLPKVQCPLDAFHAKREFSRGFKSSVKTVFPKEILLFLFL